MYLDSEEKTVSNEVPRWHQFLLGEVTEKQCWCLELGKRGTQMQAQNSCDAVWSSGERWGKRQNCFREGKTKGVNAKHKEMQQQFWQRLATGCGIETTKRSKWNIFHEKDWTDEWQDRRLTSSFPKKSVHETPYRTKPKVISRRTWKISQLLKNFTL